MTSKCLASDRLTALSVIEIQTIKLPERIREREKERETERDTERSFGQERRVEEEMFGLDIHSP